MFLFILLLLFTTSTTEGTITIRDLNNVTVFITSEETPLNRTWLYGVNVEGHLYHHDDGNSSVGCDDEGSLFVPPFEDAILLLEVGSGEETTVKCLLEVAKAAESNGFQGVVFSTPQEVSPSLWSLFPSSLHIYACTLVSSDNNDTDLNLRTFVGLNYTTTLTSSPSINLNVLLTLFLMVFLAGLTIYLFVKILKICWVALRRRRRSPERQTLSPVQLGKMPTIKYDHDSIGQSTCTICLENFSQEQSVRVLPCAHVFHRDCLDPWLLRESRKCPNCKRGVVFPGEGRRRRSRPFFFRRIPDDEERPLLSNHQDQQQTYGGESSSSRTLLANAFVLPGGHHSTTTAALPQRMTRSKRTKAKDGDTTSVNSYHSCEGFVSDYPSFEEEDDVDIVGVLVLFDDT